MTVHGRGHIPIHTLVLALSRDHLQYARKDALSKNVRGILNFQCIFEPLRAPISPTTTHISSLPISCTTSWGAFMFASGFALRNEPETTFDLTVFHGLVRAQNERLHLHSNTTTIHATITSGTAPLAFYTSNIPSCYKRGVIAYQFPRLRLRLASTELNSQAFPAYCHISYTLVPIRSFSLPLLFRSLFTVGV
ncbi:f2a46d0c-dec3-4702-9b05-01c2c17c24d5 [Sclerotinia trifoliorum]|uniref:F2a46d0c-dec3-4702-9b05-01c2c17c24d5 n=1 Tax=Sclerotinia trifoliorum TaxID=28548 RepID=A0A8H2VNH1_9HELO|nr:f2a46d0c-dec3-4702-9b05-01c2c17c24d5 [Sclerotinia trifoliorum]